MILKFGRTQCRLPEGQECINLFIVGFVLLPIYIKFMGVLSQILSFPTAITTYLYYGILWLLLLSGLKGALRKATTMVVVAVVFASLIIIEILLHPSSIEYVFDWDLFGFVTFQPTALFSAFLFIFIGLAVSDFENLSILLHKGSRIGLIAAALTYIIMLVSGIPIYYDDMSTAYGICLLLCIIVAFQKKVDWIYIIFGTICLVLAGTRGPIICFIVALLFKFVFLEKNFQKKIFGICLCVFVGVLIYSGIGVAILTLLGKSLSAFGITNLRFLDYLNEGMLFDGSGREVFYKILFEAIKERPILGYGIGGDRLLLPGGSYAHNLIFESLVSFGVIGGSIFLVWLTYLLCGILTSSKTDIQKIGIGLFCGIVMKLFFSSSFLISNQLFMFIGLCIAYRQVIRNVSNTEKEKVNE